MFWRFDLLLQAVGIGALQLGELTPVQHLLDDVVALFGQRLQRGAVGRIGPCLALLAARQTHFGEQHLAQLLGRADVERMASEPVDPTRLGVTGWSYGGYMTMWAVTQTQRFRAAVAGAGGNGWRGG